MRLNRIVKINKPNKRLKREVPEPLAVPEVINEYWSMDFINALDVNIYFAKPYRSWGRGSNENMNGLIRQFLPKNRRLNNVTAEEIEAIMTNLNNRPRKTLGYLTPLEVKSRNGVVALRNLICQL